MPATVSSPGFKVLALDDVCYGPVDLQQLIDWARDERLMAETWVLCVGTQRWQKAAHMPQLRELFSTLEPPDVALSIQDAGPGTPVRPGILRRVRVLADLNDEQLTELAKIGEVIRFPAFTAVMRAGTIGDSMFFVLDGQVRLRIIIKEREILIAVQEAGGVFGQISMFDGGPRVTDAVTDLPATLFKVSSVTFKKLCANRPDIGTPVLLALGRTLATRIRTDDRHLTELVTLNQSGYS